MGAAMSTIDLLAGLATVAFAGVFIGCSVLASGGLSLERRAQMLERRDPASADALRRAQALHDVGYIGFFGDDSFFAVCTPSRRSALDMAMMRGTDADLRVEPAEETPLPAAPTVSALVGRSHLAVRPRAARRVLATIRRRAGTR